MAGCDREHTAGQSALKKTDGTPSSNGVNESGNQHYGMRYLSALSTPTIVGQIEECIGSGRLRALKAGEELHAMGGEKFAGIIADHAAQLPLLRHGLPVVLLVRLNRGGMRQFRILAEDGIDVRLWSDPTSTFSDTTLRSLSAPRAPSPAAVIVARFRGQHGGLAADILTASAILSNGRRSMDEIARVCDASAASVRTALRDDGLVSVSNMVARMRCLHALWAWETGRPNFWSAAGFRTLAELSAHLSQQTGAPLGRWKAPGGFTALLESVASGLVIREEETAQAG
jgi:hypothetical protein